MLYLITFEFDQLHLLLSHGIMFAGVWWLWNWNSHSYMVIFNPSPSPHHLPHPHPSPFQWFLLQQSTRTDMTSTAGDPYVILKMKVKEILMRSHAYFHGYTCYNFSLFQHYVKTVFVIACYVGCLSMCVIKCHDVSWCVCIYHILTT